MIRKLFALLLFLALPGIAHAADWYEASTEHFVVYSQDRPERLQQFATNLERFDQALRRFRQVPDVAPGKANRVTVYVMDSIAAVQRLSRDKNLAGYYTPRAGGSVAFVPRSTGAGDRSEFSPMVVLLHEYTHHFMFSTYPNGAYPAWFAEGYAEFHATAVFEQDGSVDFGSPPQYRGDGLLNGNGLPIEKLLVADTLKLTDEQREALYGRGWLLTHYLFSGARKGQLAAYITAVNQGKPALEAAQVFGDLRVLDRELEHYKLGKFQARRVPAASIPVGPITLRKLGPGEAATMDVRIRSKNGVDEKTAPGVYEAAKKACAPFPGDPAAQLVLAEAAYDAGDYVVSEAAADRALAADAKAIDGYVYKAMSQMAVAAKAGDVRPETWRAIRKTIVAGNRLDPDDPEPLILFFRSYVDIGETPSKSAREGLYYAAMLAPEDRALRLNTAQVYLHDGNPEMARQMLLPLAYDPHNAGLAAAAARLIAEIDRHAATAKPKEAPATPHAP